MSAPHPTRRTCEELGVCQGRADCTSCPAPVMATPAAAPASAVVAPPPGGYHFAPGVIECHGGLGRATAAALFVLVCLLCAVLALAIVLLLQHTDMGGWPL